MKNWSKFKDDGDDDFIADQGSIGLNYSEFFDRRKNEKIQSQLINEIRELYCKVHNISV